MERNPTLGASFFKLLVDDDFSSKLRIPYEFVNKHGEILHPKIKLTTDEQCGKLWSVGIERDGERDFFMKGWSKFAVDHDLKIGEFLIFKFVSGSTLHVSVYEETGCKKDYSSYSGDEAGNSPVKVKIEDNQSVKTWRFSKEVKKHHYTTKRMDIPKDFTVGTGIARNRKIKLQDANGRKWPVKVTDRNVGRYCMTAGWKDFLIGNNVPIGSIISFEFIPSSGNIVEALVIENGTRKEHSIPAKRGNGGLR